MRKAYVAVVALGVLALVYNVFIKDEPTFAFEPVMRIGFVVLLFLAGGYELWKRRR